LVKRLLWLECVVESKEQQLADGIEVDLGGYTQAVNSLLGLLRALGLERKTRPVRRLREHLQDRALNASGSSTLHTEAAPR
jgi:hypothetical protein